MKNDRKTAVIVGALFIIGTVSGILSGVVSGSILEGPDLFIKVAANETRVIIGALLVLVMGFPLAMVPVLMYPIFKRYNEVLALGAVIFRGVLEAVCYIALTVSMLLLLTVSQEYVSSGAPNASQFQTLGTLLQEVGDWTNQILAIVFSIGALMLYYLFYRTRLVPRWLALWGFVGALLYFAAPFVSMIGQQHLALSLDGPLGILMGPLALQEMVFAVWLIVKGFNPATFNTSHQA